MGLKTDFWLIKANLCITLNFNCLTMTRVLLLIAIISVFMACKKDDNSTPTIKPLPFTHILILGNSITFSAANPSIGWNGSWGMAASAPEKDYVHLLAGDFKQSNSKAVVQAFNISAFEMNCETYDFDKELKSYRDSQPDLLIIRIGENVDSKFDSITFAKRYRALLAYMKVDNPNLKILAAGSFWPERDYINIILSRYTPYVSLSFLGNNISNYAFAMQNVSDAVKGHPGDKGMQGIAETIWAKVEELY